MAGNFGQYKDRNPKIIAAGKPSGDPALRLYKCLQSYQIEDQIEALQHEAGLYQTKEKFKLKLPLLENVRNAGTYTKVGALINPPVHTKFEHLIDELTETLNNAYWNSPIGKSRDPRSGLPIGMNPMEYTFGKPSCIETPLGELVNPSRSYSDVFTDAKVGHEIYKVSHNDYDPSEQIDRGYQRPSFDPNTRYGKRVFYDKRGRFVRNCLTWFIKTPEVTVNSVQVDASEQFSDHLGRCRTPNKIQEHVPPGHTFGKFNTPPLYAFGDLIKECEPHLFKKQLHLWMADVNQVRKVLKYRHDPALDFSDFLNALKSIDKTNKEWLPKEEVYKVCRKFNLYFNTCSIEPLMEYIGIMKNNMVEYHQFLNMFNPQTLFPALPKLQDVPAENRYYKSSYYCSIHEDRKHVDNSVLRVAGVRTIRSDLPQPAVWYPDCCAADKENLGDESTALTCVNPSIYTIYALSHRDFYKPRSKEEIRGIFEKIGDKMEDADFEEIWNIASKEEPHGHVCIETFKHAVINKK